MPDLHTLIRLGQPHITPFEIQRGGEVLPDLLSNLSKETEVSL